MRRYNITVGDKEFDITVEYSSEKYRITCNGKEIEAVAHLLGESRALLLIDGQSHEVDVRSNGYGTSKTVFMKGMELPVTVEDYNLAQLRKTAGMTSESKIDKMLKAAMPGMVLDVKVQAGDTVEKGEPLLVLEAMKMENIIKSPGDAAIKAVHVQNGQSVEKGDNLL